MEGARQAPEGSGEGETHEHEKIIRSRQHPRLAVRTAGLLAVALFGMAATPDGGIALPCDVQTGWKQRMQDQTMTVWDLAVPGSGVHATKAGGVIQASPAAVWKAITDFAHYDQVFPFAEQPRVVGGEDGGQRIYFYEVLAAPLVAKRDYTLDVHIEYAPDAEGRYRMSFVGGNHLPGAPPPVPGLVRVDDVTGYWEVKPWGMGFSHAVYCVRADPGGNLPAFFVNAAQLDVMPKVFASLRKAAGATTR